MPEKVKFKFFEGQDVEQFTFYRIPKQLFTVEYFKGMSSDAKVLYGLMLDRVSLSIKNNWFDNDNRAYIYFSIDDVMELLGCGRNKAIKCLKELDDETGIGLTQKRRQGFGKSNMIYVKTFIVEKSETVGVTDTEITEKQTSVQRDPVLETAKKQTSMQDNQQVIFMDKAVEKNGSPEKNIKIEGEYGRICPKIKDKDHNPRASICKDRQDLPLQKFENQTTGGNNAGTEVYFSNPNNTNKNNTEMNYNKSHLILSPEAFGNQQSDLVDEIRCDSDRASHPTVQVSDMPDREPEDRIAKIQFYQALIRSNIEYESLMTFPGCRP